MPSELKLPGKFAAGQKYWLDGKTLNQWRDALIADRVIPGEGLDENQGKLGRVFDLKATAGGGAILPFQATLEGANISLLGGAYQVGATGTWVTVAATAASAGSFAYLVIVQDVDRAVTSVSISVEAAALDAVVIAGDPEVATSNVPLAEVVGGELIQRRHGNFTLGLWQIDGDVVRWPETVVGSIPAA